MDRPQVAGGELAGHRVAEPILTHLAHSRVWLIAWRTRDQ